MTTRRTPSTPGLSVEQLVRRGTRRLSRARLVYGHGTERALDEAAYLVAHALDLPVPLPEEVLGQVVDASGQAAVHSLLDQRIRTRKPASYLTREAWFAGLRFYVDERVLVPRSPIAELIEAGFYPWLREAPQRVLDIGTGSGCIAIACALAFPQAQVDGVDVSEDALAVARGNAVAHSLEGRLELLHSDLYGALAGRRYDLIVTNPPYVPQAEYAALPPEYRHEPGIGLHSGTDGFTHARRILNGAAEHLTANGILVLEVGDGWERLMQSMPRLPIVWAELERGGAGVGVVDRAALVDGGPF